MNPALSENGMGVHWPGAQNVSVPRFAVFGFTFLPDSLPS